MTREQMIEAILAVADEEFQSEVRYHLGIDEREYAYDEVSALIDIEERCEDSIADRPNPDIAKAYRRLLKVARETLIAIGYYRPMTQMEIDNTWSSNGVKWAFKVGGVAYDLADDRVEQFPEGEEQ